MAPKICIILPTYNEAENVPCVIEAIFNATRKITSHEILVLVVDDNSPDGTQDIIREMMPLYPSLHMITGEKRGLGEAYKRGMRHAINNFSPEYIFEMDADGQHDASCIPLFVTIAIHGFSLVIGSRFAPGGATPDFSFYRKTISLMGNWMIRFFGGIPRIHDCTSGFRCIKAELIPKCNLSFLSTRGYSFQSSLLCELLRNKARVIEVPIIFPDRIYGRSKLSLYDQIEFLFNIVKIRFRQSEEFVKFAIVGFSGVVVNIGLYILLSRFLSLDIRLASPVAIELSILNNFIFNHLWTFKNRLNPTALIKKAVKFHISAGIAGLSNYILFLILINSFGLFDIVSNLLGILFGTLINYYLNSYWTWKKITLKDLSESSN